MFDISLTNEIKELVYKGGASICGFADLSAVDADCRRGMPVGIAIGISLDPKIVANIPKGPFIEYFDLYGSVNKKLDEICLTVGIHLIALGYHAIPQTIKRINEDRISDASGSDSGNPVKHTAGEVVRMPHKTVAAIAGLGWIAKSSLLVTHDYGSAVRLTSILTNAPLQTVSSDCSCLCGDCRICIDACPGNVIKNRQWDISVNRNELIDVAACRETVTERGRNLGKTEAMCGLCMAMCPYTKKYLERALSIVR